MAHFEKYLTEVDVKKQMAIPTDFMRHLPYYEGGRTIFLPVYDVSGNLWENFGYYIRREGKDYARPVFQGDWRKYVRANNLKPGDKIIFRVEENDANGAPRYTIAAQRRIFLFEYRFTASEWLIPKSAIKDLSHMISQEVAAIDLYSTSVGLLATTDCFFDFQLTKESPMKM
ncbi:Uncharacterized protein TCM_046144 [Theobroma cacao]|uniref:TF-B3 domain-containing protein n=1 Tax=Theobroma cacao TaxID=3641 RepID=S1S485_THECC|nr:Uncharacterized protein TCM_046144 [Theobroma cacao]